MHFAKRIHPSVPTLLEGSLALLLAACGGSSSAPPAPALVGPTITTQPASTSVAMGATASFSVVASGSAPLAYLWSKNGAAITGATAASYTTPGTVIDDSGASFTVTVSNGTAPVASSASAVLTVTPPAGSSFDASSHVVTPGEGVVLTYTFPGAATLDGSAVTTGGSTVVYPTATTTYTLSWNDGAARVATRTVTVKTYTPSHLYTANGGSMVIDNGDGTFTTVASSNTLSHFAVDVTSSGSPVSPISGAAGLDVPTGKAPIHLVTSPDERHLYVANNGGDSISAYALDAVTGAATPVAGSPFLLSSDVKPFASAFATSGKFLYVACLDSIQVFSVAATGVLTDVPSLKVTVSGRTSGDLLMHPSGKFLYAADSGNDLIRTYGVDLATGALTPKPDVASAGGPVGMTFDRAAIHLVTRGSATDPTGNNAALNVFAIDPYTGALSLSSHFEGFDAVDYNMPFVRGSDNGHHGLAFSRQPGLDIIYNAYLDEPVWPSSMSAYWLDVATGSMPANHFDWDVGRGPVPYDPAISWAGPINVDLWGSSGDSVILDRSGRVLILTGANGVGDVMVYPVTPAGSLTPGPFSDYSQTTGSPGDMATHAVFTGTLQ
jgi:sugar lactone lactonase YvrE